MKQTEPEICSDTPFGQSVRGAGSFPCDPASSGADLIELLREARSFIPGLSSLGVRIDDVLAAHATTRKDCGLVRERYGLGFAWFRTDGGHDS